MLMRLFTHVDLDHIKRPSIHFRGMPMELGGEAKQRKELPLPIILIIEERSGGVFLFRYALDRRNAGDTWHQSVEDAKHQADYEYGVALGEWNSIPTDVADPVKFAFDQDSV